MLKKLHIENFESHKDTTIEFSNGFNVIVGESDGGKSSIIRAISAVCYNIWDADSMRVGENCCKISLETDKGIVTLTKDLKKKINSYDVIKFENNEDFHFEAIGTTVPDIVYEITGMKVLDIADSTVDIPNIMFQLEKHYMLAEVSGKTCTSNLIARIFDKVIGLGGMEELISEISSSMINDKKQITKKMAEIDNLKFKLVDENNIENREIKINTAKQLIKDIIEYIGKIRNINNLTNEYQKKKERLYELRENYKKYMELDIDDLKSQINQLNNKCNIIVKINNITEKFENKNKTLLQYKDIINKYKDLNYNDIEVIKNIFNKLTLAQKIQYDYNILINKSNRYKETLEKYADLDNGKILLNDIKQLCNKLYKINKYETKYIQKKSELKGYQDKIIRYTNEYENAVNQLNKIKSENKICPLCGNPFSNCGDLK